MSECIMPLRKTYSISLLIFIILGCHFILIAPSHAIPAIMLNNFTNDYIIDGFISVWYYNVTDQQDISVQFASTTLRLITGVRITYRTQNLLNPMADCNISYKFESTEYVYYNDILPNTTGNNQTHAFYCQGDTFLLTGSAFYIDLGCASDDPYIQVGYDKDHSGYSMYSLNGGPWTPDSVEYLLEAIVENVTILGENYNITGYITTSNDFVDGYKISLTTGDTCHFYLKAATTGEHFNMRFFPITTRLTSDTNALWLMEGPITEKNKQLEPIAGEYVLLIEPDIDKVDNGTYFLYWTYAPEPPVVTTLPSLDNDGNIPLTWNSPSDTDIAYYNIYRGNSSDVPMDPAHMISTPGLIIGNSYEDATWLPDGQYFYIITAVDNFGHESTKSNTVNTTVQDSTAPANPILQNPLDFPIDNDGIVNITWSQVLEGDLASYRVYRTNYSGFPLNSTYLIANTSKKSFLDYVLFDGSYFYRVTALDDNGLESSGSNEVQTTVIDAIPPDSPKNLTYQREANRITLTWVAPDNIDLSFYYIFRENTPIQNISILRPIANTTAIAWNDSNSLPGTYYYAVLAVDLNGLLSNISNIISITIIKPRSYTLLIILLAVLTIAGSVTAYAMSDRRRNPNSVFQRFNRANFKRGLGRVVNASKATCSKGKTYLLHGTTKIKAQFIAIGSYLRPKFSLMGGKIKTGISKFKSRIRKRTNIRREKLSYPPPKSVTEVNISKSAPVLFLKQVKIDKALIRNLQVIIEVLQVQKELTAEGLQVQTALSELEVQQCLAFLSDHQLLTMNVSQKNIPPTYRLMSDFDKKCTQLLEDSNTK